MLRPASRRASQQRSSPQGPQASPYEPDTAPLRYDPRALPPAAPPYPPGAAPYDQDPSPYGPPSPPYGRDPNGRDPNGWDRYGQDPYGQDAYQQDPYQHDPYQQDPYQQDPYRQDPYGQDPYGRQGGYEPEPYEAAQNVPPPEDDGHGGPGRRRLGGRRRAAKRGRIRRLLRRRTVRVILALIAALCCWVAFSLGQALTAPGGGSALSKTAEWFRDHNMGPLVTFGEWLTYSPPKVGGKPQFSLALPKSAQVKAKPKPKKHGFEPIIPARLSTFAGTPLAGEGQWRVLETVKGQPAMFGTFLRPSSVYTSYVAGIVSLDQRLVKFQLHPGAEDPGPGNWNSPPWIPPGSRSGLLATFNGGFKLDVAGGGFYLNGITRGTLVNGAASVVYYRNGTIKIGAWNQGGLGMTSDVVGVRQNLKLIVDHGHVPASVNQNVIASWGATLGGGYYVWRSGLGITADGRIIYVYGPALNVQELASLLQRAGAVEAMQLDINPFWMSFEYYKTDGHPSDPTPVNLLPTQQQTAYRYYSIYSRDFTAVYSR